MSYLVDTDVLSEIRKLDPFEKARDQAQQTTK